MEEKKLYKKNTSPLLCERIFREGTRGDLKKIVYTIFLTDEGKKKLGVSDYSFDISHSDLINGPFDDETNEQLIYEISSHEMKTALGDDLEFAVDFGNIGKKTAAKYFNKFPKEFLEKYFVVIRSSMIDANDHVARWNAYKYSWDHSYYGWRSGMWLISLFEEYVYGERFTIVEDIEYSSLIKKGNDLAMSICMPVPPESGNE